MNAADASVALEESASKVYQYISDMQFTTDHLQ